ncbi:MAG: hypothetical protein Q7J78_05225 [Clostridiales bacterium]|nr:hypothetical protein [Clostridiales bacterium]
MCLNKEIREKTGGRQENRPPVFLKEKTKTEGKKKIREKIGEIGRRQENRPPVSFRAKKTEGIGIKDNYDNKRKIHRIE